MSVRVFSIILSFAAAIAVASACNSGAGACPSSEVGIEPGTSCNDEHLQCAYTLATPSAACDGTTTTIASSCTCTHGSWACPDPFACEADAAEAADEGGGDDGGQEGAP